jgi:hypothetical protein
LLTGISKTTHGFLNNQTHIHFLLLTFAIVVPNGLGGFKLARHLLRGIIQANRMNGPNDYFQVTERSERQNDGLDRNLVRDFASLLGDADRLWTYQETATKKGRSQVCLQSWLQCVNGISTCSTNYRFDN